MCIEVLVGVCYLCNVVFVFVGMFGKSLEDLCDWAKIRVNV